MLLYCGLLLMCLNYVRTTEYVYDYGSENSATEWNRRFSYWPSLHNALARLQKRDIIPELGGLSEGGGVENSPAASVDPPALRPSIRADSSATSGGAPIAGSALPSGAIQTTPTPPQEPGASNYVPKNPKTDISGSSQVNETVANTHIIDNQNGTAHKANVTTTVQLSPTQLDITRPGVMMRGVIVFGGFLLLAVAYLIFYRGKSNKNELSNNHNSNDTVQFRYGVLQSEDRGGNLELSRVPLTMESDEDEDEDLEIFDLEQKKKSLSYVNLQTNDEDIVFDNSKGKDGKESLLLDIEDPATDTLINWNNNGNKSIL